MQICGNDARRYTVRGYVALWFGAIRYLAAGFSHSAKQKFTTTQLFIDGKSA